MTNKLSVINYLRTPTSLFAFLKTIINVDCSRFLKQTKRVEKLKKWV